MNYRRARVAALLVASLSTVGCQPAREAHLTPSQKDSGTANVAAPGPAGAARATSEAAARADNAVRETQDAIDALESP